MGTALESILSQKVDFEYEILLADDCSSDGTPDVCRRYASLYPDRIKLILNKRNKGIVDNYYDCIEAAEGEYIADLAGDDQWCDDYKLARQVAIMESDAQIVLTHANWRYMHTEGEYSDCEWLSMPVKAEVRDGKELLPLLLNHEKEKYFIHLCTSMYRRDTVIQLLSEYRDLMRNRLWPCEDFQLEVLLASVGQIAYEPHCVLNYRVGHRSISSEENHTKNVRFAAKIVRLTRHLTDEAGLSTSVNSDYYRRIMHYLAMNAFRSLDNEARNEFRQLLNDNLWGIPSGMVPAIVNRLMSNRVVWKIAASLWNKIRG